MNAELLRWAERFIATPSASRIGNAAIARAALELCAELGLTARSDEVLRDGVRHHSVTVDLGRPSDRPGLLLVTHLDTVPPGELSAWTATGGDPHRPTRDGDRLYGLGSADAKLDFVCKAFALADIGPERLNRRVRLLGTFGEEIGMLGARWAVENGLAQGFSRALVGEPSELCAIHAHKGYAVFEARVPLEAWCDGGVRRVETRICRGVAAHSSNPALGENAIEVALAWLGRAAIPALAGIAGGSAVNVVPDRCEIEAVHAGARAWSAKPLVRFLNAWRALQASFTRRDARFDPERSVASLGRVRFEEGVAIFGFDVRPVPGDDVDSLVDALAAVASVHKSRENPPLDLAPDAPLVRTVAAAQRAVGLAEKIGTKATCTEAGIFASAGLEAVVIGAGPSVGNVHKPNEHTRVSELLAARRLYAELVRSCT